jgi:riboflavin biosynthesis pyrimidine reductase
VSLHSVLRRFQVVELTARQCDAISRSRGLGDNKVLANARNQFADRQLVDEILLGMAPVTLGRGGPLLPRRLTASRLELVDVARDRQFARLTYRVRR